ncbi:MAG: hypothetical protein M1827_005392 [Pycnora praestabilis]|nr:MAG: hypothetical protein M1827_005392 [Pycnora praestabilis]
MSTITTTQSRRPSPLDIIFSCGVCQATLEEIYTEPETNVGLRDGKDPNQGQVTKLWLTECAHLTCGKHLDGGGAPFHPADNPPRAPCPVCVENGNEDLKALYAIHGVKEGSYDSVIPKSYFVTPPVRLDGTDAGMEALRFQYLSLVRYGSRILEKLRAMVQEKKAVNSKLAVETKTSAELKDQIESLKSRNLELEGKAQTLKSWQEREPAIKHYLNVLQALAKENEQLKRNLRSFGHTVPNTNHAMKLAGENDLPHAPAHQRGDGTGASNGQSDGDVPRSPLSLQRAYSSVVNHHNSQAAASMKPLHDQAQDMSLPPILSQQQQQDSIGLGMKRKYMSSAKDINDGRVPLQGSYSDARGHSRDLMPPPPLPFAKRSYLASEPQQRPFDEPQVRRRTSLHGTELQVGDSYLGVNGNVETSDNRGIGTSRQVYRYLDNHASSDYTFPQAYQQQRQPPPEPLNWSPRRDVQSNAQSGADPQEQDWAQRHMYHEGINASFRPLTQSRRKGDNLSGLSSRQGTSLPPAQSRYHQENAMHHSDTYMEGHDGTFASPVMQRQCERGYDQLYGFHPSPNRQRISLPPPPATGSLNRSPSRQPSNSLTADLLGTGRSLQDMTASSQSLPHRQPLASFYSPMKVQSQGPHWQQAYPQTPRISSEIARGNFAMPSTSDGTAVARLNMTESAGRMNEHNVAAPQDSVTSPFFKCNGSTSSLRTRTGLSPRMGVPRESTSRNAMDHWKMLARPSNNDMNRRSPNGLSFILEPRNSSNEQLPPREAPTHINLPNYAYAPNTPQSQHTAFQHPDSRALSYVQQNGGNRLGDVLPPQSSHRPSVSRNMVSRQANPVRLNNGATAEGKFALSSEGTFFPPRDAQSRVPRASGSVQRLSDVDTPIQLQRNGNGGGNTGFSMQEDYGNSRGLLSAGGRRSIRR